MFSMLRPESSSTHASAIEGSVSSGDTSFTALLDADYRGVRFRVCVQVYKSVYTTWRMDTCLHSANPCPTFLVVDTYARLVVANWTFNVLIWLYTYGRPAFAYTPIPHLGTLYLTVSRTFSLCKGSNAISRPSYFPHTSTFQRV